MSEVLPDGTHDAFVVDVIHETDGAGRTITHVEITLVSGEHKGLVLQVATPESIGSFEELVGMPATLTVADGTPSIRIDR
ncbi:MAG: hypothetical protein ACYC2O_01755 [Microthrixaceae bacterium]